MSKLFPGALISYGPILPVSGTSPDGSLFYKTESLVGGPKGLYVYGFTADTNGAAFGPQVSQGWVKATADQVDADTLDGFDSSYFQPQSSNLDTLSGFGGTGLYTITAAGAATARTITSGSSKISITNGNGVAGNPSIDVSEANLTLNNLGGILSVAKGGTNLSATVAGGILYGSGTTAYGFSAIGTATTGSGTSQNWQVLTSTGASAPAWVNASSLNVSHAVSANTATSANSASSVAWTGVTGAPTTLAGYGITDTVSTTVYTDAMDFLNFSPFAGILKENKVPVYSTFDFSQTSWASSSFAMVDKNSKQVLFYRTQTPTARHQIFRAYRYTDTDTYIFDNEPVQVPFLNAGEKVWAITNMGTNFAVLKLTSTTMPETLTRVVMVYTYGSSDWHDWTLAYTLTSLSTGQTNFGLVFTNSGDRILRTKPATTGSAPGTVTLEVYNSSLTLLRSQVIWVGITDMNPVDPLGLGRTITSGYYPLNLYAYAPYGSAYAFTWSPFTETFHQKNHSYSYVQSSTGANSIQSQALDLTWSIPKSWIESGTGTPVNLIPIKTGTYRYNQISDITAATALEPGTTYTIAVPGTTSWTAVGASANTAGTVFVATGPGTGTGNAGVTWESDNGGVSTIFGSSGIVTTLVTDEYSGDILQTTKNAFVNTDVGTTFRLGYSNGYIYKTLSVNNTSKITLTNVLSAPDGSPWSKTIVANYCHIIDDNIMFHPRSTQYGTVIVYAQFSLTSFASIGQGATDDTLKIASPTAIINPHTTPSANTPSSVSTMMTPGAFGVVVTSNTPQYYHTWPNNPVYLITTSGSSRIFTATGLTMPAIPSVISGISINSTWQQTSVWNGSVGTPIFWTVVKEVGTNNVFMAKYVGGSWSIPGGAILTSAISAGNSARGDTLNTSIIAISSGQMVLTENGRILFNFDIPVPGDTTHYWASYSILTDTATTGQVTSKFRQHTLVNGGYTGISSGGGSSASFGFSNQLGYYRATSTNTTDAVCIISSRDIRGVGADIGEEAWFAYSGNTGTTYEIYLTTESSVGLVAYISSFPIFLGGYYSSLPNKSVMLTPNAVNYIYASRDSTDRTLINISAGIVPLAESFSRVLIATVTTDSTNIIAQQSFNIAYHDTVEDLSNVSIASKVLNDVLSWDGNAWITRQVPAISTSAVASTTVARDASSDVFANRYNQSSAPNENPTISQIMVTNSVDGYLRKASVTALASALSGNAGISQLATVDATKITIGGITASALNFNGTQLIDMHNTVNTNTTTTFDTGVLAAHTFTLPVPTGTSTYASVAVITTLQWVLNCQNAAVSRFVVETIAACDSPTLNFTGTASTPSATGGTSTFYESVAAIPANASSINRTGVQSVTFCTYLNNVSGGTHTLHIRGRLTPWSQYSDNGNQLVWVATGNTSNFFGYSACSQVIVNNV